MRKFTGLIAFIMMAPNVAFADISLVYPQQSQCQSNLSAIQVSGSRWQ